jgi:hypothetical protein
MLIMILREVSLAKAKARRGSSVLFVKRKGFDMECERVK